jgi:hypothetical protein
MLLAHGPLRVSADHAAATYSALANPNTFALLTQDCGWGAEEFQHWLEQTLAAALLG